MSSKFASMAAMSQAKHSRALAALRDVCALAGSLPSPLWMPALLEALHALLPSQRNLFDWCDADGRLTHYLIEGPVDPRIAKLYFDEFHNRREADAMPGFAQALRSGALLHSAAELNRRSFFDSALYAEIWRPQGMRYRVELIPRDPLGRPLGSLVLYRGPGERCFSAAEEARLLPLAPHLARALARDAVAMAAPGTRWVASGEAEETLLIDHLGHVAHASRGAARLLLQAGGGLRQRVSADPFSLPLLAELADQARVEHDLTRWLDSAWGRFELRARRLQACDAGARASWVSVSIRRHEPQALADERRLQHLQLPPAQTAVCRLLLAGHGQAEVAQQLGVAPSTVIDHCRKLYKRLGVHSLRELQQRVREA